LRVLLTHRALKNPVRGDCGVCSERCRLQQLVVLGVDELAICHDCFKAAAHFARLSSGYPILFDLERSPLPRYVP
jgi:hypothetical protein